MSTLLDLTRPARPARPASSSPVVVADPVPRAAAVVGLVAVAAIHFAQVVPTIEQTPYLGALFLLLTLACSVLAARLLVGDSAISWAAVGVVNAAAILGYMFTRMFSTFVDNQDVGNWSEMLGLVALLLEGILVAISAYRLLWRADRTTADNT